ncbi:hypothetical protein [Kitasatospora kifunensis]|uniref:Uncharacterized protein n=1 Tax=Kitasatospora kifunensis TaxID=58351 RepID=A0A7W7R0K1_KITKI|nr:hypothetical protein [Kitasatospora kifunensis]MBB4923124.1 hypothetical protein [Kitasatospora kifunensis]
MNDDADRDAGLDAEVDAGWDTELDEEDAQLIAERGRVDSPPTAAELTVPALSRFLVKIAESSTAAEYQSRLRAVLGAALDHTVAGLDLDYLEDPEALDPDRTVRPMPQWFEAISGEGSAPADAAADAARDAAPEFARLGAERFTAAGHGVGRRLAGWLERFDWDNTFRTWEWWDVTRTDERTVSIWVNAHGEDFFACEELRWAAYTAGAVQVTGPDLVNAETWLAERAE